MKKTFRIKNILVLALIVFLSSCSEELETSPGEYASQEQILESPVGRQSILTGAYVLLYDQTISASDDYFGLGSVMLSTDLTGQDMILTRHSWFGFDYRANNRNSTYRRPRTSWQFFYKIINTANNIIKTSDPESSDDNIRASAGQGYALRAFAYHYLVRLYQHTYIGHQNSLGVPLYTENDLEGKPRATVQEIYNLITSDLNKAIKALEGYKRPDKTVINSNVAHGILARVYLDMQEWQKAAENANKARQGYSLMSKNEYISGFNNINNNEWIWGSAMSPEAYKEEGKYQTFVSHMATETAGYTGIIKLFKAIDKKLYETIPDTDIRKSVFFFGDSKYADYVNKKFKDKAGGAFDMDIVYMRASEMYLIEAEAKARMGSGGADELYDLVYSRDKKYTKSTKAGNELIDEIILQRRIELWGEGFGWFDLKRLKKGINRDYEGTNHREKFNRPAEDDKTFTYQIPIVEFESNPNMDNSQQNP